MWFFITRKSNSMISVFTLGQMYVPKCIIWKKKKKFQWMDELACAQFVGRIFFVASNWAPKKQTKTMNYVPVMNLLSNCPCIRQLWQCYRHLLSWCKPQTQCTYSMLTCRLMLKITVFIALFCTVHLLHESILTLGAYYSQGPSPPTPPSRSASSETHRDIYGANI